MAMATPPITPTTPTFTTTSAGPTPTPTLSTHRPAPPSPATSRRTSRSAAPSPSPTPTPLLLPPTSSCSASRILIRDFAYAPSSPLFCPPFPPPTTSSDDLDDEGEDEEDDEGEDEENNNNSFKWGINRLSWTFHPASTSAPADDFERNFAYSSDDDEDELDEECDEDEDENGEALPPGRYRALYPFQAESASEMSLAEDDVVVVVGRGGGVGWAVVERAGEVGGGHALVPESYLQAVAEDS